MSVEEELLAFGYQIGICRQGEANTIRTEYKQDNDPQVYILRRNYDNKAFRFRIQTDRFNAIKTEYYACCLLNENGLKGFYPRPIGYYTNIPKVGSLAVSEYIEGISLDKIIDTLSAKEYQSIADQIVMLLKKIHSVKCSYFHYFTDEKFFTWKQMFKNKFNNHLEKSIQTAVISIDYEKIQHQLMLDTHLFENKESSLLHFDIKPANMIYQSETGKIFLIDFEMSRFGDILFEFAKGSFASDIFMNQKYEFNVWKLILETYLEQPYGEIKQTKLFAWYSLYHYLAYANYKYLRKMEEENIYIQINHLIQDIIMAV